MMMVMMMIVRWPTAPRTMGWNFNYLHGRPPLCAYSVSTRIVPSRGSGDDGNGAVAAHRSMLDHRHLPWRRLPARGLLSPQRTCQAPPVRHRRQEHKLTTVTPPQRRRREPRGTVGRWTRRRKAVGSQRWQRRQRGVRRVRLTNCAHVRRVRLTNCAQGRWRGAAWKRRDRPVAMKGKNVWGTRRGSNPKHTSDTFTEAH